jgi:tetratricopeptide (TPR) repeat protein
VVLNRPRKGIPFISIASAGVQIVVTGINSEGLALGLHMQYTKDVASRGVPILRITEEILSTCKTVRDAVKLTQGIHKTMAGWTIILSQAKDDAASAIEFSARKHAVVLPRSNHLCYANNYQDSKMVREEYYLSQNYYEHNLSRCERMDYVMDSLDGKFTLDSAFHLMTDRFDPYAGKVRASGNTVGQIHSISSVIFVPEADELWMADAKAPTNLTDTMLGFKISDLFQNQLVSLGQLTKKLSLPDNIFVPTQENQDEAHRAYTDASVSWFDHMDLDLTLNHLQKAIDSDPTEAIYYFVRGLFLLRAKSHAAAQISFEAALRLETLKIRQMNSRLWIARSLDLQKNRPEAVRKYKTLLDESSYKDILQKARRGLARAFSLSDAQRIDPFMPFADAYL